MNKDHIISSKHRGGLKFDLEIDGFTIRLDGAKPLGDDTGPSPKKLLLGSMAGCTGMDVASLLEKMRVDVDDFSIEVGANLTTEHPKVYDSFEIVYHFYGSDFDSKKAKIEKAIALSLDRYCGVTAMLRKNGPVDFRIEYHEAHATK